MATNPIVYILCGVPTAGKSTWADSISAFHLPCKIISRDTIRLQAFQLKDYSQYVFNTENEKQVTKIFNMYLDDAKVRRQNIILDNTHVREKYLDDAIKDFEAAGYTVKIKFFTVSVLTSYIRNLKRRIIEKKYVPWKTMKQMRRNFESINREKYKKYE